MSLSFFTIVILATTGAKYAPDVDLTILNHRIMIMATTYNGIRALRGFYGTLSRANVLQIGVLVRMVLNQVTISDFEQLVSEVVRIFEMSWTVRNEFVAQLREVRAGTNLQIRAGGVDVHIRSFTFPSDWNTQQQIEFFRRHNDEMAMLRLWLVSNFPFNVETMTIPELFASRSASDAAYYFLSNAEIAIHLTLAQRMSLRRRLDGENMVPNAEAYLIGLGLSASVARSLAPRVIHTHQAAQDGQSLEAWLTTLAGMSALHYAGIQGNYMNQQHGLQHGRPPAPKPPSETNPPRFESDAKKNTPQNQNQPQNQGGGQGNSSMPIPQAPKPASLTNKQARDWYVNNVRNIGRMLDRTKPLMQQARQAFELRNQFKVQARSGMSDRATAEFLNRTERPLTWESAVSRYDGNWQEIINASMRTRSSVDAEFGITQ